MRRETVDAEATGPRMQSIDAAWTTRLFAGGCAAIGAGAAFAAAAHLRDGEPVGTWLLPVGTGALAAVLGAVAACVGREPTIGIGSLGYRVLAIILLIVYAFVLLPLFGFLGASVILIPVLAAVYAGNRWSVALGGLAIAVAMWALFAFALGEPLPAGLWGA